MATLARPRRGTITLTADARPVASIESIDGWLDAIHGLAIARVAERRALAESGRVLRVRLLRRDS